MIFSILGLMLAQQQTAPAQTTSQTPPSKTAPAPAPTLPPMPAISLGPAPFPDPDKVIATINGQKIYAKDVAGVVYELNVGRTMEAFKNLTLLQQEADRRGIKISDADLKSRIEGELQKARTRVPKDKTFDEFLTEQGFPVSFMVIYFKAQMLMDKLGESDFKAGQYVRYSTLLIRPKDETTASLSAALSTANTAYAELKRGGNWDVVLKKYATISSTTANHGDQGWLPISILQPETQKEISTAKAMDILPPVKDVNGVEIIQITALGRDVTGQEAADLKARMIPYLERGIVSGLQQNAKVEYSFK